MNKKGDLTPKKKMLRYARKKLSVTPIKFVERRNSSIPLQLKELISKNGLNQANNEISKKNSFKGYYSSKKHCFQDINSSIPEESDYISNEENKSKKSKNDKIGKTHIKDNYYYINYINNVYKNESHLNKESIIKTPKANYNKSFYSNIINPNKRDINIYKRRNSALNNDFFNLNFHKNLCLDKEPSNQKLPNSFLNKMKSAKLNNLIKKITINEKETTKNNVHNKSKSKKKKKSSNDSKHKDSNKKIKNNNNNIKNEKKVNENEKINDIENAPKTDTVDNNKKNKIKIKSVKNFLCCLISSDEPSIINE